MIRSAGFAILSALLLAPTAFGQAWAARMFERASETPQTALRHDFGTVARGSKQEVRFRFKNIYEETVHVARVRSSCGCTTPTVVNPTLKTYETGEIVAPLNTRTFVGRKNATITVTFDKPYYAEVQLYVSANIRTDVVLEPGVVQFGTVDQGTKAEQRVAVKYAGRSDWQLLDVQSAYGHVEVEMSELSRGGGRVEYELLVRLDDTAPVGYVNDQLILVTNDDNTKRIPLAFEGRIESDVTVTPARLYLGHITAGQQVTKKLIIRGKDPFKIVDIDCQDDCFAFNAPDVAKTLHVVSVTFTAKKTGKVSQTINVRTDRGKGVTASLVAYADVDDAE